MRFYRNGGQITNAGTPLEISTPYSTSEVAELGFVQSADTLYLVHPNHAPRFIGRTGPDTFTINPMVINAQPVEWSGSNYPGAVTFFEERLVFSKVPNNPQTIWFSKSFDFDNFQTGTASADSFSITLSSDQANAIQWLLAEKKLLIGTTGGEWTVSGNGGSVTKSNVQALRQSNHGSKDVQAKVVASSALYVSADTKKLRAMEYSFNVDGYSSPEISLLSEHITRAGIKSYDHAKSPDSIAWCVLNDGKMSGVTLLRQQDVVAWHRHETQGEIQSLAVIEQDDFSEVWLAVKRNGNVIIERMARAYEGETVKSEECIYLDSALSGYFETPITSLAGLDHLEGLEVAVLADGSFVGNKTVESGSLSLDFPTSYVVVGLTYESVLTPMRPEGSSPRGVSQGKRQRVYEAIVRLDRTLGLKFKQLNTEQEYQVSSRFMGEMFDSEPSLVTDDLVLRLPNKWDRDGRISLKFDTPYPATILMIVLNMTNNE